MTSKSAKTMLDLPEPLHVEHRIDRTEEYYTAAQMHQYARDYAAALSQTAGVPDRKTLFEQAEVLAACYRLKELVEGVGCERWQNANGFRLKDTQQWVEFYSVVTRMQRLEYPTPAAPAASGGEAKPEPSPKQCRERLMREGKPYPRSGCDVCKTGGLIGCPYEKGVHAPQPPAGASQSSNPNPVTPGLSSESDASVSERARELLAAEFERAGMPFAAADCMCGEVSPTYVPALRALEQALTQQRGSEDGRSTSYSREALEIQGARWRALCRVIDHMAPGWDANYVGAVDAAGAAVRVLTTQGSTTPQPGADAVRWRAGAILGAAYRNAQNSDPSINFCTPEWSVALSAVEQALTESPSAEALRGGIRNVISRIINDGRDREWVIRELESLLARGGK